MSDLETRIQERLDIQNSFEGSLAAARKDRELSMPIRQVIERRVVKRLREHRELSEQRGREDPAKWAG